MADGRQDTQAPAQQLGCVWAVGGTGGDLSDVLAKFPHRSKSTALYTDL
jgi:hypothetical protein